MLSAQRQRSQRRQRRQQRNNIQQTHKSTKCKSDREGEREKSYCVGVFSIFNDSFVKFTVTDAACIHNNIASQCHAAFMRPFNTYFNSLRPGQRTLSVNQKEMERWREG